MNPTSKLSEYIADITGDWVQVQELPSEAVTQAPLFLRTSYRFFRAELFGRKLVLALEQADEQEHSPSEYANHLALIQKAVDEQTVLVPAHLPAYARNRLIRLGVPFIVPGKQMFLPMLLVDLRERFPKVSRNQPQSFSRPGQVVLLYYLLGNTVERMPLRDLAARVGYSAMTLSNVRDELVSAQLCEVTKHGRSRSLTFGESRRALWKKARPRMRSPVQKVRWICWDSPSRFAYVSGMSALSHCTPIADDHLPTYAMHGRAYRKQRESGDIRGCHGPDEADAKLEIWSYDPAVLATEMVVDPLSLYLSMRESADERVALSLQGMLQSMKW